MAHARVSNKGIAREPAITPGTVKVHVQHVFCRLGSRDWTRLCWRCSAEG